MVRPIDTWEPVSTITAVVYLRRTLGRAGVPQIVAAYRRDLRHGPYVTVMTSHWTPADDVVHLTAAPRVRSGHVTLHKQVHEIKAPDPFLVERRMRKFYSPRMQPW